MKDYVIYQIDSFTTQPFTGNPAGVVSNADGLTEKQMQQIARELNNSETAFIFESDDLNYNVHVRFFTPTKEVPICGHATIAAHYVRALEQDLNTCTIIQKTGVGLLPVDIIREKNDYSIIMTQGNITFEEPFSRSIQEEITAALGLATNDLDKRCPIQIVSTGHSKIMIGIKHYETLNSLRPDLMALTKLSEKVECNGFFVFTLEKPNDEVLSHGRMFAPAIGINEDPVTGNAHGPLGAYLVKNKLIQITGNTVKFTGMQGEAIARPGKVHVVVSVENDVPTKVKVIGNAVVIFKTIMRF